MWWLIICLLDFISFYFIHLKPNDTKMLCNWKNLASWNFDVFQNLTFHCYHISALVSFFLTTIHLTFCLIVWCFPLLLWSNIEELMLFLCLVSIITSRILYSMILIHPSTITAKKMAGIRIPEEHIQSDTSQKFYFL